MSQQVLTFAGSPLSGAAMIAALETKLQSLASSRSGTSRPSDIVAGEEWLDTTTATAWLVKRWDGVDDITIMTINTTANTVTFTGTATSGANSNITSLAGLTTPLSVAQGGTASATAAGARTALGLVIGTNVLAYSADVLNAAVSKVRTKAHPSTKSAVTDNSLTPDLSTAEVFDWTPTGAATLNAPTIIGAGVWAIRYNYTSGPTLPKATYDGSAWVATGDILMVVGFGSADYELVWLNKA